MKNHAVWKKIILMQHMKNQMYTYMIWWYNFPYGYLFLILEESFCSINIIGRYDKNNHSLKQHQYSKILYSSFKIAAIQRRKYLFS